MSKRHLSKQQTRRITSRQKQQIAEAQATSSTIDEINNSELGLVVASYGATVDVLTQAGKIYRCQLRQNLGSVVTGDKVLWLTGSDTQSPIVTALLPRSSQLLRPDARGKLKLIAANIDQMFLVIAPAPTFSEFLIDRYLIAAEALQLNVILVLNKCDLLATLAQDELLQRLAIYQKIGYSLIITSTMTDTGHDTLTDFLKNKTNIFVGQSGVGKSSLIKTLLPNYTLAVGDISENSQLGMHTTTTTRLFSLPQGGQLIDSPGVRDFDLWQETEQEIAHGFIEFRAYLTQCRFRSCIHHQEPGCAVLAAVNRGEVSSLRLESYHRLLMAMKKDK